ncbi:MAG: hypothetical protein ACQERN_07960 [Thermodesulfobacteriota bacterium]
MNAIQNRFNRFRKLLAAAYRSRAAVDDAPKPSLQWRQGLMRTIRQIDLPAAHPRRPVGMVSLSYRLAPVAVLLMVLLSIYIIQTGGVIDYQMAALSVSEPASPYLGYMPF